MKDAIPIEEDVAAFLRIISCLNDDYRQYGTHLILNLKAGSHGNTYRSHLSCRTSHYQNPRYRLERAVVHPATTVARLLGVHYIDLPHTEIPTLDECLPTVIAAAGPGANHTYDTYWTRMATTWGDRRLDLSDADKKADQG